MLLGERAGLGHGDEGATRGGHLTHQTAARRAHHHVGGDHVGGEVAHPPVDAHALGLAGQAERPDHHHVGRLGLAPERLQVR